MRETSRPARYDLNQIPYGYAAKVMNTFKGLGLVDRVPEGLWMEVCNIVKEAEKKPSQRKRKARRQTGYWRLLWWWDSPGKNTGVHCHALLQRIVLTQGLNPGLLHCRQILNQLSYKEVLAKEIRDLKCKGEREGLI